MQVMGIVQALSPKPKLHAAFPLIADNCLTAENAEKTMIQRPESKDSND